MNCIKKLVAALTATTLIVSSGLGSVCMAARDNRGCLNTLVDGIRANHIYALKMLESADKNVGLKSSDQDGNYLKMDRLSDEEKKIYDEVFAQVEKIKDSVDKDSSSDLKKDSKLAKAIFFWIRNNIKYDKESVNEVNKQGYQKLNPNRKPQDALTVFKNRMGVCSGFSDLAQLMMKMAGLPCLLVINYTHTFSAVWLDSLGGWALFDTTPTEKNEDDEEVLANYFTAVSRYGISECGLRRSNEFFIVQGLGSHCVYLVGNPIEKSLCKYSIDLDGVSYIPLSILMTIKSDNDSICINENLVKMNRRCEIIGDIRNIQNFDVFIKNFVRVDVAKSHIQNEVQKDGIEYNLSCDGNQSKLVIKPSDGSVECKEEVEIPDELVPFLADIDIFDVDSSIKTVKYDLLIKEDSLKKGVILPKDVKFEQTS